MALFWLVSKIDEQDTSHNEYTTKTIVITIAAGLGGFAITMILHFCMPEKRFKGKLSRFGHRKRIHKN